MEKKPNQAISGHPIFFDPLYKHVAMVGGQGIEYMQYVDELPGSFVDENGDVTFNFYAPNAKRVQVKGVSGTMSGEKVDLEPIGDGFFSKTISGIPSGFHYHDFFVDDVMVRNQHGQICYGCFSAKDFIDIPAGADDFYLMKEVPHGDVVLEQYHSNTDIFKIVEDGEWTLGKLHELTKDISQDLNEDNVMRATDDFFGIAMFFNGLSIQEFVIGAGSGFCTVKDDDLTMDNLKSEKLGNLIDDIKGLFPSMKYTYGDGGEQQNVIDYAFKGGRSIFLAHQLECAMFHLRDMDGDYAVIPYPKADTEQKQYISNVNHWCDCFVSVPLSVSGERTEFVGFMMEAMAAYSRTNLYPFIYGSVLKYQRLNDPQSSAMIDVIMDGIVIDYSVCYDIGGLALMTHNAVMNNTPLSSSAIGKSGAIKSSIKQILAAHGVKK